MDKKKMASIKDVATLAGVGVGTVSRVMNESGYVSEEARKGRRRGEETELSA